MFELTNVQFKVMEFIFNHMDATGTPPTIREIASYFQWKAIGSAQDVIAALRKKGALLSPVPGKSRQIVPTKDIAEIFFNYQSNSKENLSNNKIIKNKKSQFKKTDSQVLPGFEDLLRVPLIGSVRAGMPQEAIENAGEFITFPSNSKVSLRSGKIFALQIDGFSMIKAGFLPNDIVLVEANPTPQDKDIVIASIYNGETTLKRFAKKGSLLYKENSKFLMDYSSNDEPPAILVPENSDFVPLPFGLHEDDKIIGIVRSLYRKNIY
jgi:repressor LexA